MIGNVDDAAAVLAGSGEAIGEGCARRVYLYNGIVYKVEDMPGANVMEYERANELRNDLPANIVIPDMTLFHVNGTDVLAMPFITGEPSGECIAEYVGLPCSDDGMCFPPEVKDIMANLHFDLLSWGNTIRNGRTYYIVDLD